MIQFFINTSTTYFIDNLYFISQHFFITSSTNIQRTLTKHSSQHSSQQIEWCIIHHKHSTNIFEKRPSKHSTNIFEKRPSKHSFQQTMIHFFINTSAQTFTIGELVIELHHIFIMIKWQIFNEYFNEYFIMIKWQIINKLSQHL